MFRRKKPSVVLPKPSEHGCYWFSRVSEPPAILTRKANERAEGRRWMVLIEEGVVFDGSVIREFTSPVLALEWMVENGVFKEKE